MGKLLTGREGQLRVSSGIGGRSFISQEGERGGFDKQCQQKKIIKRCDFSRYFGILKSQCFLTEVHCLKHQTTPSCPVPYLFKIFVLPLFLFLCNYPPFPLFHVSYNCSYFCMKKKSFQYLDSRYEYQQKLMKALVLMNMN